MPKPTLRNLLVWSGVLVCVAGLWLFAGRTRLHLIDPLAFIGLVAVAAAAITGLLWWEICDSGKDEARTRD